MTEFTALLLNWPNFWTWLASYAVIGLLLGLGFLFRLEGRAEAARPAIGLAVFLLALYPPLFFPHIVSLDAVLSLAALAATVGFFVAFVKAPRSILMWGILFLISMPLTFIFSARGDFGWDGYTTWLPAAKLIYLNHAFPSLEVPPFAGIVDYPFGLPLQHALVGIISGSYQDNATTVLNAIWAWTLLAWFVDRDAPLRRQVGSALLALPVLYFWQMCLGEKLPGDPVADPLLCVLVTHFGLLTLANYFDNQGKDRADAIYGFIQLALIATSLPLIKEAGSIFAMLIFGALIVVHLIKRPSLRHLPWTLMGTGCAVFVVGLAQRAIWKYYIHINDFNITIKAGGISSWKWWMSDKVLWGILEQTNHRPFWVIFPILLLLILGVFKRLGMPAIVGRHKNYEKWDISFAINVSFLASIFMGAILFLIYIASFSIYEASNAASFPRYIAPLGVLSAAVFWIAVHAYWLDRGFLTSSLFKPVAGALYLSFFVAMLTLFASGRLDIMPQTQIAWKAVDFLEAHASKGNRVYVVEDDGNCLTGAKVRYYSAGKFPIAGNNCNFGASETPEKLVERLNKGEFEYIAFFSGQADWNSLISNIKLGPRILMIDNGNLKENYLR